MLKTALKVTTALALSNAAGLAAAEPLRIGASPPSTGNFSINGLKHKQGYELCVDLINERGGILGREVELIVSDNRSDNRSDAATALAKYERFINVDGVEAVFGTFSSKLSFPFSNVLAKYGMVYPLPAGGVLPSIVRGTTTSSTSSRTRRNMWVRASTASSPISYPRAKGRPRRLLSSQATSSPMPWPLAFWAK